MTVMQGCSKTATLTGRVVEVSVDKGTGALTLLRVDSSNGMVQVFKPDAWGPNIETLAWSLGKRVTITVEMTVEP